MRRLYASPLRVYLALAFCAAAGILSGFKLPVSLFPNSSKPTIGVWITYGNQTAQEFLTINGQIFEDELRSIATEDLTVDKLRGHYYPDGVLYDVEFKWGAPPRTAYKEVQEQVNAFASRLPEDVRDQVWCWPENDNSGEIVVSFFSASRSLDELFDLVEPLVMPDVGRVPDASDPELWNPTRKEIRVELEPRKMATLGLFPNDIERAIRAALASAPGGTLTVGASTLLVQMPRTAQGIDTLRRALVVGPHGAAHLSDVARVDYGTRTSDARIYKTSGAPSIILFASPRPGGNVKKMSEDILDVIRDKSKSFPPDVHYKVLVDPSEFIRSAIHNVFREVGIGALLAVAVLFLFIGSLRNTITAAIEIPLSMVLAFVLMKLSGMNLNLISLGGLALSAGMNVDASVVVMENIFRHFEELPEGAALTFERKLTVICEAVAEVRFAVIASTIASLVVFLPLAFTSELSYAILGDLAKTVVFSHGFSMFVALILVPTVRLQLMTSGKNRGRREKPVHSPIEGAIRRLENGYARALEKFVRSRKLQLATYASLVAALIALALVVLPRLPREVIGMPDTDWIVATIDTRGNTLIKQMESQVDEIEARLLAKFGPRILYTFASARGNNHGKIMLRLRDKGDMRELWPEMEKELTNSATISYTVAPWNPSELPIPNPPQLKLAVRDSDPVKRNRAAHSLFIALSEADAFPRMSTEPGVEYTENVVLRPRTEQWLALKAEGATFLPSDLADVARVATSGRRAGLLPIKGRNTDIMLHYPDGTIDSPDALGSIPIGVGAKLVPLKALADVRIEEAPPAIYRENEREVAQVLGRKDDGDDKFDVAAATRKSEAAVAHWRESQPKDGPSVVFEDAEVDLHEALRELGTAVGLSVLLIFITLIVQFGDVINSLLVLVAVPLGFIGVLVSLFVFRSTLSLNSVLGVILLNGIAVANSILLVDFLKRLVAGGMSPARAAAEAGRKRLRPILITSATTILGMLPIAFGLGDGGRVLQPLGIAVSGGLWVSMGLTLFIVPALQVSYLEWRAGRRAPAVGIGDIGAGVGHRGEDTAGLVFAPTAPKESQLINADAK